MKTAIYVEDGVMQIVITPETEFEKNVLGRIGESSASAKLFVGSFYDCRGGWIRQSRHIPDHYNGQKDDRSLILRLNEKEQENEQAN